MTRKLCSRVTDGTRCRKRSSTTQDIAALVSYGTEIDADADLDYRVDLCAEHADEFRDKTTIKYPSPPGWQFGIR